MRGGALWERGTRVRRTSATESGSLPTPTKYDSFGLFESNNMWGLGWFARHVWSKEPDAPHRYITPEEKVFRGRQNAVPEGMSKIEQVLSGLPRKRRKWNTPTCTQPIMNPASLEKRMSEKIHKHNSGVPLVEQLQREALAEHRASLPTPTAVNGLRGGSGSPHRPGACQAPGHPEYGDLNPEWVEWLMGWPVGWTSLDPISPAEWACWQRLIAAGPPGACEWWDLDPTEDPQTGMSKTVPVGWPNREERISALGNGQASAAMAGAFLLLTSTEPPPEEYK